MTISDFWFRLDTLSEHVIRARRTKPLTGLMIGKGRRYVGELIEDGTFLLDEEEPYILYMNSHRVLIKNVALVKRLSIKNRKKSCHYQYIVVVIVCINKLKNRRYIKSIRGVANDNK